MKMKEVLKVVLLGDTGVGKTSLIKRYVNGMLVQNYKPTIGTDFMVKTVDMADRSVTMQIWDTAGQERFQSLGAAYYRGADCCVLVFDVSKPISFYSLDGWKSEFLLQSNPQDPENFPFVVLGNKGDLNHDPIFEDTVVQWCQNNGNILYYQTSARNGHKVDEAFEAVVKCAYKNESNEFINEDVVYLDNVTTERRESVTKNKKCC